MDLENIFGYQDANFTSSLRSPPLYRCGYINILPLIGRTKGSAVITSSFFVIVLHRKEKLVLTAFYQHRRELGSTLVQVGQNQKDSAIPQLNVFCGISNMSVTSKIQYSQSLGKSTVVVVCPEYTFVSTGGGVTRFRGEELRMLINGSLHSSQIEQ